MVFMLKIENVYIPKSYFVANPITKIFLEINRKSLVLNFAITVIKIYSNLNVTFISYFVSLL